MKKILSALLAAAAVGAMTVAASAETEYFEVAGMKGTMYDVVTADGYDSFVHVWETEDGCSSIATYYFEEGGYYSHYTMELIIPEDCTLEQFNKSLNVFYTEDQITAVDGERYTVNEDSLPDVVGYDELNAEGAREYNREIVIFLKYLEDTQGGEDGTTDDGVAEDGASDDGLTDDGTADDEIVDEGADDVRTSEQLRHCGRCHHPHRTEFPQQLRGAGLPLSGNLRRTPAGKAVRSSLPFAPCRREGFRLHCILSSGVVPGRDAVFFVLDSSLPDL